jgi:predicted nucleic acid-binding protein
VIVAGALDASNRSGSLAVIRLLLDTSAYAAFLRGHAGVQSFLQEADEIFVNPVVLGELKAGFAGGHRQKKNENELALFLASSRVRVRGMDEETAERYATIVSSLRAAGTPIPTNDVWIAASAMQYGLRLVTFDERFRRVPQVLVDWFERTGN